MRVYALMDSSGPEAIAVYLRRQDAGDALAERSCYDLFAARGRREVDGEVSAVTETEAQNG